MKRTILIVDDDASVRSALQKLLEGEGYRVLAAGNSARAFELFDPAQVHLVVMDVNLGTDDGWGTFERIAAIDDSIPTVVATAEFGQHERAIEAGVEALIEKPMDVAAFLHVVDRLLSRKEQGAKERRRGDPRYCRYVRRPGDALRRDLQERSSTPLNMAWFGRALRPAGINDES